MRLPRGRSSLGHTGAALCLSASLPCGTTHTLGFHLVLHWLDFTNSFQYFRYTRGQHQHQHQHQIHACSYCRSSGSIPSTSHASMDSYLVCVYILYNKYYSSTNSVCVIFSVFFSSIFFFCFPANGGATVATRSPLQIQRTRPWLN